MALKIRSSTVLVISLFVALLLVMTFVMHSAQDKAGVNNGDAAGTTELLKELRQLTDQVRAEKEKIANLMANAEALTGKTAATPLKTTPVDPKFGQLSEMQARIGSTLAGTGTSASALGVVSPAAVSAPPPPIVTASAPVVTGNAGDGTRGFSALAMRSKGITIHTNLNQPHNVLALSEEDFLATPLDTMMGWYGAAQGGGSCEGDFGNGLARRWRETKASYCTPKGGTSDTSAIDCYLVRQTRHAGGGDNICVNRDVSVNMGYFGNDQATSATVEHYVQTSHNKQPYLKFPKGFIAADQCALEPSKWVKSAFPGWNEQIMFDAVDTSASASAAKSQCTEWVDHPVLVVQRDTFANFFHDSEDFINAFLAMAVLQWNVGDTQLYLTDLYPQGPFWDVWFRVFGRSIPSSESTVNSDSGQKAKAGTGWPAMTAWDLRRRFAGGGTSSMNPNNRVCYRKLAVGIYGPAAPICVISWNTPCFHTALVRAYSDFIIRGMNLQSYSHYALEKPSRVITITYMARRSTSVWPEKKYCDDQNSFFRCHLWDNFGTRSLQRRVSNDADIVKQLKRAFSTSSADNAEGHQEARRTLVDVLKGPGSASASATGGSFGSNLNFDDVEVAFRDVDYNILSFEEQIKIDLSTDIMIGPHGAGLTHNAFMRDRAVLIELFVDGSGANRHFHNLAKWYGRNYIGESMANPVSVDKVSQLIRKAIAMIDINKY